MSLKDENKVLKTENEDLTEQVLKLQEQINNITGNSGSLVLAENDFQKQMFIASVQPFGENTTFVMKERASEADNCSCSQTSIVVEGEEARKQFAMGDSVMVTFAKVVEVAGVTEDEANDDDASGD